MNKVKRLNVNLRKLCWRVFERGRGRFGEEAGTIYRPASLLTGAHGHDLAIGQV